MKNYVKLKTHVDYTTGRKYPLLVSLAYTTGF